MPAGLGDRGARTMATETRAATATAAVGCSDDSESSSNGGVLWWNDDLRTHARGQRVSSIIAGDVHYAKNYQ